MRERRRIFLAYPFGDYEGVRAHLDRLAREGWVLRGRSGLFTGEGRPTRRTELYYDVVPALPWRSETELRRTVARRQADGWEPVDTFWGMDIYRSRPCRYPVSPAAEEAAVRRVFRLWLTGAALLTALAGAAAGYLAWSGLWAGLTEEWYFHDEGLALLVLTPILLTCMVLFLLWLAYCIRFRCRAHRPAGRIAMALRALIQAVGLTAAALLPAVLWVSMVPRLWIRLTLLAALALLAGLSRRLGRRLTLLAGAGLLLTGLVLAGALSPVRLEIGVDRGPVIPEAVMGDGPRGTCRGWYGEDASLLTRSVYVEQFWESGQEVEAVCCRCLTPWIAEQVEEDFLRQGRQTLRRGRVVLSAANRQPLGRETMEKLFLLLEP